MFVGGNNYWMVVVSKVGGNIRFYVSKLGKNFYPSRDRIQQQWTSWQEGKYLFVVEISFFVLCFNCA